jgi:hypothetical protein
MALFEDFLMAATATPMPVASSSAAPILTYVPIKIFGIGFLILMVVLIGWYLYARRR